MAGLLPEDLLGPAEPLPVMTMLDHPSGDLKLDLHVLRRTNQAVAQFGQPGVVAAGLLGVAAHPREHVMALNNHGLCLCQRGEFAAAAELVAANRPLYEELGDSWVGTRLAWLEARIARGLGDAEAAERHLRAALNAFLGEGNGFNAALAALDLGRLLLEQGRTVEVKRIDIDALAARLNGRLAAPEVIVPANTQNQEGNIRITL